MGNQCCTESRKDHQLISPETHTSGDEELINKSKIVPLKKKPKSLGLSQHTRPARSTSSLRKDNASQRNQFRKASSKDQTTASVWPERPSDIFSVGQRVLVVGDGDLSFSLALSNWLCASLPDSKLLAVPLMNSTDSFQHVEPAHKKPMLAQKAANEIVASVFDTRQEMNEKYGVSEVQVMVSKLKKNTVQVYYGIDATKLDNYDVKTLIDKNGLKFDRIVFNFPHAGFPRAQDGIAAGPDAVTQSQVQLVDDFLESCKSLLKDKEESQVIITQNTCFPFKNWNVVGTAKNAGYKLVSKVPFNISQFPGYQNRRGFGPNAAKSFDCSTAETYSFCLERRDSTIQLEDLSKDLQSMKDELFGCSTCSPIYTRQPTAASPNVNQRIVDFRNSDYRTKYYEDEEDPNFDKFRDKHRISLIDLESNNKAFTHRKRTDPPKFKDIQSLTNLQSERNQQNQNFKQIKNKMNSKKPYLYETNHNSRNLEGLDAFQTVHIQKHKTQNKLRIPKQYEITLDRDRADLNLSNFNTANTATVNTVNLNMTPKQITILSHNDEPVFKQYDYLNEYKQQTDEAPKKRRVRKDQRDAMLFESHDSLKFVSSFDQQLSNPISHQNIRKQSCTPRKEFNGFKKINSIKSLYTFGDIIGEGSFGKVRLAVCKKTKMQYAAKIMKKTSTQGETRNSLLQNEIEILSTVEHPNIIDIHELLRDDTYYFIISEYIEGGQLFEYMQTKFLKRQRQVSSEQPDGDGSFESEESSYLGKLSEQEARMIAKQLFNTLSYLHRRSIVHRDVKPENILLQFPSKNVISTKLIDFGFAAYCKSKEAEFGTSSRYYSNQKQGGRCPNIGPPKKVSKQLTEVLGSPLYMAPEIVKKQSYDHKVDVWSAGVVIYAMLSGRLPFFGSKKEQVYSAICTDDVPLSSSLWSNKSADVRDFLRLALSKDPELRPSSSELLAHPWLQHKQMPEKLLFEKQRQSCDIKSSSSD